MPPKPKVKPEAIHRMKLPDHVIPVPFTKTVERQIKVAGVCSQHTEDLIEAALIKGRPGPGPDKWMLRADLSKTINNVVTFYRRYYVTKTQSQQFWADWEKVEQSVGQGDRFLSCNLGSWENGGGGP